MPPNAFAEQLKKFRSELAYTQEGLAAMLGLSYRTILRWEQGQPPSLPNVAKLIDFAERKHGNSGFLNFLYGLTFAEKVSTESTIAKVEGHLVRVFMALGNLKTSPLSEAQHAILKQAEDSVVSAYGDLKELYPQEAEEE